MNQNERSSPKCDCCKKNDAIMINRLGATCQECYNKTLKSFKNSSN